MQLKIFIVKGFQALTEEVERKGKGTYGMTGRPGRIKQWNGSWKAIEII
jgi:hypothetical protein